jgi:hypothetical protein
MIRDVDNVVTCCEQPCEKEIEKRICYDPRGEYMGLNLYDITPGGYTWG